MTASPIITTERVAVGYKTQEKSWTYDEIRDLFGDDSDSIVMQLLDRCIAYEKKLAELGHEVAL